MQFFFSFRSYNHSSGLLKLNLTSCNTFCYIFCDPVLCWNDSKKLLEITWKCENWKWPLIYLSFYLTKTVFKSSEQADFKTDLTSLIWWRFHGNIPKNRIHKFSVTPFILPLSLNITSLIWLEFNVKRSLLWHLNETKWIIWTVWWQLLGHLCAIWRELARLEMRIIAV